MEKKIKSVLFIDDDCHKLLPTIEIVAKECGYRIISSNNVAAALNVLQDFAQAIYAVILDLSFPENETQGIDALDIIKEKYSDLPVIILTDSDGKEHLQIVVECMKKGAYNYISKSTLNPVYLFQVVSNAIEETNYRQYIADLSRSNNESFLFYSFIDNNQKTLSACFGFELVLVLKPSLKSNEEKLKTLSFQWHQNLIKTINNFYDNSIQVNLKYLVENAKIKCYILFTVYADNKKNLLIKSRNFQSSIKNLFIDDSAQKNNIYIFKEIKDKNILKTPLKQRIGFSSYLFYRAPLKIEQRNKSENFKTVTGFRKTNNSDTNLNSNNYPSEIFSLPVNSDFNNDFLSFFRNMGSLTEVDIQLEPKDFSVEEIDMLKNISKNPSLITDENNGQINDDYFKTYLHQLLSSKQNINIISLVLNIKEEELSQALLASIKMHFFGDENNINYVKRDLKNLYRYKTDIEKTENNLPFLYHINGAIQSFHLPFPDNEHIAGIKTQTSAFKYLPDNIEKRGTLLGVKDFITKKEEIRIGKSSISRHLYIMGQTGTGKTTLLKTMIKDCINNNQILC